MVVRIPAPKDADVVLVLTDRNRTEYGAAG
jgi:hypothetical protein